MAPFKILLADDSRTMCLQLQRTLTAAGYEVVVATDGEQAVEMAQTECPNLLILDINMPELDGYGVCERLKQMGPPWSQLPIVFLTCLKSRALELLGHEFGAYLHKPVNPDKLLSVVDQQISQTCG